MKDSKKKIEIKLPEDIFTFFKVKAIYKNKKMCEELEVFIKKNVDSFQGLPFEDFLNY